jgi:hypothetical protein
MLATCNHTDGLVGYILVSSHIHTDLTGWILARAMQYWFFRGNWSSTKAFFADVKFASKTEPSRMAHPTIKRKIKGVKLRCNKDDFATQPRTLVRRGASESETAAGFVSDEG